MKKYWFLLIIGLVIFACSSDDMIPADDDEMMNPVIQPIYLLKKIYLNDMLFSERFYDSDSMLTSIHYFKEDTVWRKQNYSYNGDTIQVDDTNSADELTNYKKYFPFEDDKVQVDRFNADHDPRNTGIYYFNPVEPCGYELLEFFDPDGTSTTLYDYNYTAPNCNVTAFVYENGVLTFKDEYIRDNKSVHIQSALVDLLHLNNLGSTLAYTAWDENDQIIGSISYNQMTTYNSDDYPVEYVRTYQDGTIETYSYEYD